MTGEVIGEQGRLNLASLEPMFERAAAEGKWFRSSYQGLCFAPSELRALHARGKFVWSAENWQLVDPSELIAEHERLIVNDQAALAVLKERIRRARS